VGELEGAGHLDVFPPWRRDDLDADGQAGCVVMVDGHRDRDGTGVVPANWSIARNPPRTGTG
jgi:hypothetical protein